MTKPAVDIVTNHLELLYRQGVLLVMHGERGVTRYGQDSSLQSSLLSLPTEIGPVQWLDIELPLEKQLGVHSLN